MGGLQNWGYSSDLSWIRSKVACTLYLHSDHSLSREFPMVEANCCKSTQLWVMIKWGSNVLAVWSWCCPTICIVFTNDKIWVLGNLVEFSIFAQPRLQSQEINPGWPDFIYSLRRIIVFILRSGNDERRGNKHEDTCIRKE